MTFSIVVKFFSLDKLDPWQHKRGGFLEHRILGIEILLDLPPKISKSSQADLPESRRFQPDVILLQ